MMDDHYELYLKESMYVVTMPANHEVVVHTRDGFEMVKVRDLITLQTISVRGHMKQTLYRLLWVGSKVVNSSQIAHEREMRGQVLLSDLGRWLKMMGPESMIQLPAADLVNKFGFGDGDMFDRLTSFYPWLNDDYCREDDRADGELGLEAALLDILVRRYLLPKLPSDLEYGTEVHHHNPCRVMWYEGNGEKDYREWWDKVEAFEEKYKDIVPEVSLFAFYSTAYHLIYKLGKIVKETRS